MMRELEPKEPSLFAYHVNLERRVPADHPLREIKQTLDLAFVAPAVKHTYGLTGNPSVPPESILRMMFLLFYYNIPSERELMQQISLRLDFLWFLDWDLDSSLPNHSVLSKARNRWGRDVFEQLFTRTVSQCVAAGLVDGKLLHLDSTLVRANASKDSVRSAGPELVAALRQAYVQQEQKLEAVNPPELESASPPTAGPVRKRATVNETHLSITDPDAHLARDKDGVARLSYKDHRLVDDAHGVITAVKSTDSCVGDGSQLPALHEQHQANTHLKLDQVKVAGDRHYGTAENFRYCLKQGLRAHLGETVNGVAGRGLFAPREFLYQAAQDRFVCPGAHHLVLHQTKPAQRRKVYLIEDGQLCQDCPLRVRCTRAKRGRSLEVPEDYALLQKAWAEASSPAARYSRRRRRHVMEGSFADAANNHGAKSARWRRQWRQQIQSWLIAAIQNLRLLIRHRRQSPRRAAMAGLKNQPGGILTQGLPDACSLVADLWRSWLYNCRWSYISGPPTCSTPK